MTGPVALGGAAIPGMGHPSRLFSITQQWGAADRAVAGNIEAFGVLLTGLCLGVVQLLMYLLAICCRRIKAEHLTLFQMSLTFSNILQSLSSPVVAMDLMGVVCQVDYCGTLISIFLASRRYGTLLYLLVTLEFMMLKTESRGNTKRLPVYLTLPFTYTVGLICIMYYEVLEAVVAVGSLSIAVFLAIGIYAVKKRRIMDKRSIIIVCTTLITVAATYLPSFVLECIVLQNIITTYWLWVLCVCLANLRMITDHAVLWMICRSSKGAQEQMQASDQPLPVAQTPL